LVRLKMRNLLTSAVSDKTFKAGDKFKEPDLQLVPISYLYSDRDGSYFLDQENFETLTLPVEVVGNALKASRCAVGGIARTALTREVLAKGEVGCCETTGRPDRGDGDARQVRPRCVGVGHTLQG
jgi:hypothetical protein